MKTRKSKQIFGMSQIQMLIVVIMACFAGATIMGMVGFIIYNASLDNQPIPLQATMPIPVLPTMTKIQPTRTSFPTVTFQPTLTKVSTPTKFPTIIPTATLWFQINAANLIPTEDQMPSGYRIDTPSSGSKSDQYANYTYVGYISDYPNDKRNKSGDPYLVTYTAAIFKTVDFATSYYDEMNESWISSRFGGWYNTSQVISPSQVNFNINGIERTAAYISDFNGVSVPGYFVFIKLQNHNGIFIIRTLSHAPFTNKQRALASANYFASLLIQKLTP